MANAALSSDNASDEQRIAERLARYDGLDPDLVQAVRKVLRKRFPALNELVYDYADKFVIGYSPTHTGAEGIAALSAESGGVRFYLTQGAKLPDPHKLLQGKAGARFITVASAEDLLRPEVEALMAAAERTAKVPVPASGRGTVIIKPSDAEKPRRRTVRS
ncbi:MAG TPA: hypothetical protein VGE21_05695 [Flavobacteriales bacterium]